MCAFASLIGAQSTRWHFEVSKLGSLLIDDMHGEPFVSDGLSQLRAPKELTTWCALQENAPSVRSHSGTLVLGLRTPQAPPPLFMSQVCACHPMLCNLLCSLLTALMRVLCQSPPSLSSCDMSCGFV